MAICVANARLFGGNQRSTICTNEVTMQAHWSPIITELRTASGYDAVSHANSRSHAPITGGWAGGGGGGDGGGDGGGGEMVELWGW